MVARLRFGQGANPAQWYLSDSDIAPLPNPVPGTPAADSLGSEVPIQAGPAFGGLVNITLGATTVFDVVGGWNSVKNAQLVTDVAGGYEFRGFVHVDFDSRGTDGAVNLSVVGSKRGNVATGDGNDSVTLDVVTNERSFVNAFRVNTGEGDDRVVVRGLDRPGEINGGDATFAVFVGTGGVWDGSGRSQSNATDLGQGNDIFEGFGTSDSVQGGLGDDDASLGTGTNLFNGGGGRDTVRLAGNLADYTRENLAGGLVRFTRPGEVTTLAEVELAVFADQTVNLTPATGFAPVRLANVAAGIGGYKILGEQTIDLAGFSIAGLGDLNGDGYDDHVVGIGIRFSDPPPSSRPAAYVVFGKPDTAAVDLDAIGAGTSGQGFAILAEALPVRFGGGYDIAGAGDVNGDGRPDLIVGDLAGERGNGAAYVVFGPSGTAPIDLAAIAAGTSSLGFKFGGGFATLNGFAVAGAGDINQDGLADVIVGAPGENNELGAAYVVFGTASGTTVDPLAVTAGTGGFKIVGAATGFLAGWSVGGGRDVNGDGRPDVLVHEFQGDALGRDTPGVTSVVFGKADTSEVDLGSLGSAGFRIVGENDFDRTGIASTLLGDMNGDGKAEILVAGDFGSAAYVVFGKADDITVDLRDIATGSSGAGFKIVFDGTPSWEGLSVESAGDVNGDGRDDLLLGVPSSPPPFAGGFTGAAYLVLGKDDGATVDLAGIAAGTSRQGVAIIGEQIDDRAGSSVSAAGDVNNDGFADLLVGASGNDSDGSDDNGAAYVVFGRADWIV